jgi:hypothetical protein
MFYCNFFRGEQPLFEDAPQGDSAVEVRVDERSRIALQSLLNLGSFEVAHALAALYVAGVRAGERAVRGHTGVTSATGDRAS